MCRQFEANTLFTSVGYWVNMDVKHLLAAGINDSLIAELDGLVIG